MKKLFFIFLFFILYLKLVNPISIYPIEINSSTQELIIQNHFNKEIFILIENINFEKNISIDEKIIIDIDKTILFKKQFLEINVYYDNLNFNFEIPINFDNFKKNKKPFPIFIISSIILGICVVIIIRKF
jgi:hypothetical protein